MAYDLGVQGVRDFHRLEGVLGRRKISRDPLSGVVDGVNKIYHTNYFPLLSSGSTFVYVGANPQAGTVDVDTGEITTGSAPGTQPVATYTFTPYTTSQQLSFLIGGLYEMEARWTRGWKLLDAGGGNADEDSANLYVDDAGSDPLTGKPLQIGFYMACCRYSYLLALLTGSANTDYEWRETVRGMSVDKSRRPTNLAAALEAAERAMQAAMEEAQNAFYTDGSHLGSFIGSPMTLGYVEGMEWQSAAEIDDNRSLRGNRSLFALTV